MDALILSRIQFALNISFHILFPIINIALCWFLLYFKVRFDLSGDPLWMRTYRFWVKVFALTFALGVVSGITMSFQFGTNWPGFMEQVGNIAGPLLGYEVLTAFFLEATFLGIMLFGTKRVPSRVHTFATFLVALGTTASAFWILALNSWMHTPTGHEVRDGVAYAVDWWAIIFNPSFPYRLAHTLLASGITAAFFVAGISAYRIRKGDTKKAPKLALRAGIWVAAVLLPLQIFVGDLHGLNTLEHQPEKIAAMEGVWDTEKGAPLLLFAIPDEDKKENHLEIGLPGMASLILTHDIDGEIKGLNDFEDHPPVKPLFYGFRLMVGLGVLMLAVAWYAIYLIYIRKQQNLPQWFLRFLTAMTFSGWVASLAGWYVTEIGRQPWLVAGVLRTSEAVTSQPPQNIVASLIAYVAVYGFLLVAYIHTVRLMARKAVKVEEYETKESYPFNSHRQSVNTLEPGQLIGAAK